MSIKPLYRSIEAEPIPTRKKIGSYTRKEMEPQRHNSRIRAQKSERDVCWVVDKGSKELIFGNFPISNERLLRLFADESYEMHGVAQDDVEQLVPVQIITVADWNRPIQRLKSYLREVSEVGDITKPTATLAWHAWNQLRKATSYELPVPDACPGARCQLLYTWDRGEHHFELEVFPDGAGEFFYLNRVSDEVWEAEYVVGTRIPHGVEDKLKLFL